MPGARSQLVLLVLGASTAAGEEFFLAEEKSCEAGSWHGDAENSAHFAELMVSLAKAPAAEPLCRLAGCPEATPAPLPMPVPLLRPLPRRKEGPDGAAPAPTPAPAPDAGAAPAPAPQAHTMRLYCFPPACPLPP